MEIEEVSEWYCDQVDQDDDRGGVALIATPCLGGLEESVQGTTCQTALLSRPKGHPQSDILRCTSFQAQYWLMDGLTATDKGYPQRFRCKRRGS